MQVTSRIVAFKNLLLFGSWIFPILSNMKWLSVLSLYRHTSLMEPKGPCSTVSGFAAFIEEFLTFNK